MTSRILLRTLAAAPLAVAGLALFVLMLLTFFDVLLRSAFDAPIEAAAEVTRLLMATIVFSALPVLSAAKGHVSVDLLDSLFERQGIAGWRDGLVSLACAALMAIPGWNVVALAERSRSYGDRTEYLGFPQHILSWFIALMVFTSAIVLFGRGLAILVALLRERVRCHD